MNDEWTEIVRQTHASGGIACGADAVLARTATWKKNSTVLTIWLGAAIAKRLDWKDGETLAVSVSRDGRRVLLVEAVKGSWKLKAGKTRPQFSLRVWVPEIVKAISEAAPCTYELDERAGTLTLALPVAAAKRVA